MLVSIKKLTKIFDRGNTSVGGEKGTGKDVLCGNVVARFHRPYISNLDYTKDDRYIPINFKELNVGGNGFRNFLSGKLNYYKFPYPDKTNVILSDSGIYFPCQEDKALTELFPEFATFQALQRQLADACTIINSQDIERPWVKIREQTQKRFFVCQKCTVLFGDQGKYLAPTWNKIFKKHKWKFGGIVIGKVIFYEREKSAIDNVPVFPYKAPLFKKKTDKINIDLEKAKYLIQYGKIIPYTYICINKSKHDSRAFKTYLENGDKSMKYTKEYFDEYGLFGEGGKKKNKNKKKVGEYYEKDDYLPFK